MEDRWNVEKETQKEKEDGIIHNLTEMLEEGIKHTFV